MPIYEFYCPGNNKIYSFYARTIALAGKIPRCPADSDFRMERLISKFSVTGRARRNQPDHLRVAGMHDSQMDATLAGVEREIGGMDLDNPDPRTLARMMRKISGLTGERMPGQMDEMIRRMEAGEDPDELEAEYGDALEGLEAGMDACEEGADSERNGRPPSARPEPARDPVLYEMRDFLD